MQKLPAAYTVQEANREPYEQQRAADANLYGKQKDAEAQRASTEASAFAKQQAADSDLYAKKKETEGIIAIANAESIYLNTLMMQLGGNYLAPLVTRQQIGRRSFTYGMLAPLLKTVHEQTGMLPPAWLGSLPEANGS
ncbi:hypothetical protein TIFTF001_025117 [Ficus carica]|uniref:Flotillin-like n=1 Tax=Ficus carica TaxID=3494 RepID=A0AA88AYI4_FICCA|nr:hypothetical protein TIFTF001_025117 [Ficus carica]